MEFVEERRKRMDSCHIRAYAKINLGLDVIRRLESGYHEVKMIMQTIDLYDELTISRAENGKSAFHGITIITNEGMLPTDENNLIYKAADIMKREYGIREGIHIDLKKNIPIAAGMAGGSSDAAATFWGISRLFGLKSDREELMRLGVRVGADVPYCILGGTALAEGIGEKLTPLCKAPDCYVLIAKPALSVSTRYVYENLHAESIENHPDIDGMAAAIRRGDLDGITARMENVLERVTAKKYPVIEEIKGRMMEAGAENSLMSGSGPTVFGIFKEEKKVREAYESMTESKEQAALELFVTRFCEAG